MKRKLALLMAGVMTLSLVPSLNAFAASDNSISVTNTILPGKSVVFEKGVLGGVVSKPLNNAIPPAPSALHKDVEYGVNGTDLIMVLKEPVTAGDQFTLALDNGVWFFRDTAGGRSTTNLTKLDAQQGTATDIDMSATGMQRYSQDAAVNKWIQSTSVAGAESSTFDRSKGYYGPDTSVESDPLEQLQGSYFRYANALTAAPITSLVSDSDLLALIGTATIVDQTGTSVDDTGKNIGGLTGITASKLLEARIGELSAMADITGQTAHIAYDFEVQRRAAGGAVGTIAAGALAGSNVAVTQAQLDADAILIGAKTVAGSLNNLIEKIRVKYRADEAASLGAQGYLDTMGGSSVQNATEIPYKLTVSHVSDKEATITILNTINMGGALNTYKPATNRFFKVSVPLVVRSTADGELKVKASTAGTTFTGGYWMQFAQTQASKTKTFVNDPLTARDEFKIDKLVIEEARLNSIKGSNGTASDINGHFTITAPSGFEFEDPSFTNGVRLGVQKGLAWDATTGGVAAGTDGLGNNGYNYTINFRDSGNSNEDRSVLEIKLNAIIKSTATPGAVFITGLKLFADENAKLGDIMFKIKNSNAGITDESFKAGVRAEWDVLLSTEGTIPTLVNGRYQKAAPTAAEDEVHKTATIVLKEGSVNAWWADRQTIFTLSDGAKFRKVEFLDADEFEVLKGIDYGQELTDKRYTFKLDVYKTTSNTMTLNGDVTLGGTITNGTITVNGTDGSVTAPVGVFLNDGIKHGLVTMNGNTMTLNNLRINKDKKSLIRFDAWISVEAGVEGDIKMTVSGSAIPVQSNGGVVTPVTIAKAISPVTVTTKITDIKTGYQLQSTADVLITETLAGNLQKGKKVMVSVSDLVSTDMLFSPDVKVTKTDGDLKIKDINYSGSGYTSIGAGQTSLGVTGGTLTFTVDVPSSKASTVTLSNVSVKVDRTVPESNKRAYKVIVWGEAIAPNYTYYNYDVTARDKFATAGIMADYVKVITSADDKSSILSQEVKVTIGETYFVANGITYDMDAASYISKASNSTMVPVRFIAQAFGIRDELVIWDGTNKIVTINAPSKIIQFKANDNKMVVNGTSIAIQSPDGLAVAAEITGERMYVPFRAMGEAFGVTVVWDDATQTAIYNPATAGAAAAVSTTTTGTVANSATTPATTTPASPSPSPAA